MAPRRPLSLAYSERAHDQIERIRIYIEERSPQGAARVVEAIHAACLRLASRPFIGRPGRSPDTREWSVTRYPYVIVYQIINETVMILAVFHTAQGERKL